MTLHEMIYHRKSCRNFTSKLVDAEMIEKILSFEPKHLYPEINGQMDIVSQNKNKCIFPGWNMHKSHWLTMVLDGTVEDGKIK